MIMDWESCRLPKGGNLWQGVLWQAVRKAFWQSHCPNSHRLQASDEPLGTIGCPKGCRSSVFRPFLRLSRRFAGIRRPYFAYLCFATAPSCGERESGALENGRQGRLSEHALNRAGKRRGGLERGRWKSFDRITWTDGENFSICWSIGMLTVPLKFREPRGDALLARLQRWTFEVFSEQPEERKPLAENDESIVINSCHGAMREAEVLRDYLLRRFAEDPTLRPRDVVVMMPDPEGYAPYLRATFGGMEKGMPESFPFSIVDREPRRESQLVDCFFDLLEFFDGRATNREVMDLLDSTVFRARFELEDQDIEAFRDWIRDCHAHWGLNAEHRERFGSVKTDEHTWRSALDRMALGFCMRSNGERMWDEVLPFDEIEGENALRFGKLFKVIDALTELEEQAAKEQSLVGWVEFLGRLTDEFFPENNETLMDRGRVRKAIRALLVEYSELAPKSVVPLRVIRYHLSNVLDGGSPQGRFLTSGVTFCGLRPMRSVNARVICLIGMNDGAFRHTRKPSFDLSGDRQPGDRSSREDDRYLFLETIWCAREHLYLSSRRPIDPPKPEDSPLRRGKRITRRFGQVGGFRFQGWKVREARDELVRVQTLHPFGKENYLGGRIMRSFSKDNLDAAKALLSPDEETHPFLSEKMSEPKRIWKS